jgi:hypothetical protein
MFVLAMDVNQVLARLAQLRCGDAAPIDKCTRTPAAVDDPPHEINVVVTGEIVFGEPVLERCGTG